MGVRAVLLGVGVLAAAAAGCGGSMECERSDDPLEAEHCVQHGGTGEAVGTAVAAGVTWTVTGCRVNGCNLPYTCNDATGFCERLPCGEGQACPPPYECDLEERRCE